MFRKLFFALLCLPIVCFLAIVGCRHINRPQAPTLPPNASAEDRDFAQAEYFAKLGNWDAARPLYVRLEEAYRQKGDPRNELYVRVSRYRAEIEFSDLELLSDELGRILSRPDVQSDLVLKQRVLEVKGNVDLNFDGVSARPSFEELERVARQRGDKEVASRASGELGILAFLEGNAAEARDRVVGAIANAVLYRDIAAEVRYSALLGQGLVESRRPAEGLIILNQAIREAESTPDAGYPKIAISGKANALIQLRRFRDPSVRIPQLGGDSAAPDV